MINNIRNTVGKLARDNYNRINKTDREVIKVFSENPKKYLDLCGNLALDVKFFVEKVSKEHEERKNMKLNHLETVTDKDLEAAGVSKREFSLITKLMKFDPEIFEWREFGEASPMSYVVDLSKYKDKKIT